MHTEAVLVAGGRHHPHQFFEMHDPEGAGISYHNIVYYNNPQVSEYMHQAMNASDSNVANKYWKLAQWNGKTGASGLGDAPYIWLIRLDHTYLGNEKINFGKQPIHTHGHEWSLLANIGEWTWNE